MNALQPIFAAGGPSMYVLLAGAVMVVAILIERTFVLFVQNPGRVGVLLDLVEKLVREGQIERVRKLTGSVSIPSTRVIRAAIDAFDGDPSEVKGAAQKAVAVEARGLLKRLARLALLGIALGLIGAVGSWQLQRGGAVLPDLVLPLGRPTAEAPLLFGGASALVALVAAGLFAVRALSLRRQLELIPPRMSALGWAWSEEKKRKERGF